MSIHTGIYQYHKTFYTGTKSQPDTISVFVKSKDKNKSFHVCNMQAYANGLGYFPIVGCFTGLARVVNAVKSIFNELSKAKFRSDDPHLNECWNAFKNLFRGLVELVPLAGGITLIVFDAVRNTVFFQSKIEKKLGKQEGIVGIAIDGKLVFTVNIEKLKVFYSKDENAGKVKSDEYYLAGFSKLCLEFLKTAEEKGPKSKLSELFQIFKKICVK